MRHASRSLLRRGAALFVASYRLPARTWKAFRILHTIFVILRGLDVTRRFLGLNPLPPAALKAAVLELGVCFIKLAQVLATRADFFSKAYLAELRAIHDEVPPMAAADLDIVYKRAFGETPPFTHFDKTPLAAASIGQVHEARLEDGARVAVKLRRLDIERRVATDIRILESLLFLFRPFFSAQTRNSLEAVIAEFTVMIRREVDMAAELQNLRRFQRLYGDLGIRMPAYFQEFSSKDALVMSFEEGVRIDDVEAIAAMGVDFTALIEQVVRFYTEQMLVKGVFHCDPHPGNLLVAADGVLVLLDYGMVKRLSKKTRVAMIEYVKAAHDRDYEAYVAACKRLGVVAATAPDEEVQEFAERMFEIFSDERLSAASMQALAFDVLDNMKDFPFKLPQEIVYVMRASALIEGLGVAFVDNFNGVKDILPILRANLDRALGEEAGLFPTIKGELTSLPLTVRKSRAVLDQLADGSQAVQLSREGVDRIEARLRRLLTPLAQGAALALAGLFLQGEQFPGAETLAWACMGLGALRLATGLR